MARSSVVSRGGGLLVLRLALADGTMTEIPLPVGTTPAEAAAMLRRADERVKGEGIVSATAPVQARRGRPRTGSLEFRGGSWHVRLTVTVEGKATRKWLCLDTADRELAERKVLELRAKDHESYAAVASLAAQGETYGQLASRVKEGRRLDVADAGYEEARERRWILPVVGDLPLMAIRPKHVMQIYERAKEAGKSLSHLRHLRTILRHRFGVAMAEEIIRTSPADGVRLPKAPEDHRERTVLSDDELAIYLGWTHPDPRWQPAVRERQTMSALARMFGGLRTGDLHALDWSHFDAAGGAFTRGVAPRRKTARPQRIVVPDALRPILVSWWMHRGCPVVGPIFPSRRGENQGKAKVKHSHADAFRRDLKAAFRSSADAPWEGSARWKELFEETELTRPVDFHSWRRAFVQALAFAGINAQTAQSLAGHSDLSAHERYLRSTARTLEIPTSALPCGKMLPKMLPVPEPKKNKNPAITPGSRSGWSDLNAQPPAPKAGPLPG